MRFWLFAMLFSAFDGIHLPRKPKYRRPKKPSYSVRFPGTDKERQPLSMKLVRREL
jgi:hypothetical protein